MAAKDAKLKASTSNKNSNAQNSLNSKKADRYQNQVLAKLSNAHISDFECSENELFLPNTVKEEK